MRTNWLITTAVIAIAASTGFAGAQGMNDRGAKSPGATERSAPQSQMQGAEPRGGAQQRNQTTGQAPQADRPSGQMQRGPATGQAPQAHQPSAGAERQQPHEGAQQKSQTTGQHTPQSDRPAQTQRNPSGGAAGQAPDSQRQPRAGTERQEPRNNAQQKQDTGRAATTGRGEASGVSLTSEQRTKIRQVIVSKKIPQVTNVNFTVSVGAKVPRAVVFHPMPAEIVEIYPAWSAYQVILVGSELVIVNPASYEIVAVVVV